jgi:hypothetical protein
VRQAKQFLSLLLLECTHLILEQFALKETLPLMLQALELDTLVERRVN